MKRKLFSDKNFLREMIKITLPISLQSLIQASFGIIDQLMIGSLGAVSVAAVGIGDKLPFILLISISGITAATSIFTAQFWGGKDTSKLGSIMGLTFLLNAVMIVPFLAASLFFPSQVLSLFTGDTAVIAQGRAYLMVVAAGYIPNAVSLTYAAVLRGTRHVNLPMAAGLISVAFSTGIKYLFLYGNFGLPKIGVAGMAVATVISQFLECFIIVGVLYLKKYPGAIPPRQMLKTGGLGKMFLKVALPLFANEFLWALSDSLYTMIYGHMGTNDMAAMVMTYPVQQFSVAFFTGVSSAASIMLGNCLGAGEEDKARRYAADFIYTGLVGALAVGAGILALSPFYFAAFNVAAEVKESAHAVVTIFSAILFIKVLNMIIGGGILRSGGKTKITMILDTAGGYLVGLPMGLLGMALSLRLEWVYLMLSSEELVRMIVGAVLTKRGVWIKNMTESIGRKLKAD